MLTLHGYGHCSGGFCFHLLDSLRITRAGEQIPVPPYRAHGLLAALLLRPATRRRERLVGLLFPDIPESVGRRRLSDLLWLLRRAIPDLPVVSDAQQVFLPADVRWLDVEAFRRGAASDDLQNWLQALALYQGDLLEENYDDWLVLEREALYLQHVRLLHRVCGRLLQDERFADVIPLAERLVQAESCDEKALRSLMQSYHKVGRRGAALAVYDRFLELVADDLGVGPEPATRALAQAIRAAGLPARGDLVLTLSKNTSPETALCLAREALWRGDWATAQGYLRQIRVSPGRREDTCLLEVDMALSLEEYPRAAQRLSTCRTAGAPRLARQARVALGLHDAAQAHKIASEALLLAHDAGDRGAELEALLALAAAEQQLSHHAQGMRSAGQALSLAREIGAHQGVVRALNRGGFGQLHQGRYTQALSDFYEARSVALEHGLRPCMTTALRGIRLALVHTGRMTAALPVVEEELQTCRDLGMERREAVALEGLALILDYLGRSAGSLRAMEQALELSQRLSDPVRLAISQYNLACTLLYRDDANACRAAEQTREALAAFRAHGQTGSEAAALTILGYALWVDGQHGEALECFRGAHAASAQAGKLSHLPELLAYQGLALLGLGQHTEALSVTWQAVFALAQGEVSQEVVTEICYAHAMALQANGAEDQASNYYARAYENILAVAAQLEDEAARQAFFYRNPTMRRLMRELHARGMAQFPREGTVTRQLPAKRGSHLVQVQWAPDAGPADAALKRARGAIALRRARLSRLLKEARSQGAEPTTAQLAEALGVSERTVQRDLAALRDDGP